MKDSRSITSFSSLVCTLPLILSGVLIGDVAIVTAAESTVSKSPSKLIFKLPPKGAPGPRTDSGSRDACPATPIGLTAIVPGKNAGQTLSDRPTIWAYVPFQATPKHQMEIEIKKSGSEVANIILIQLPKAPGIIQIPLPSAVPAMNVGDRYSWTLRYSCDPKRKDAVKLVRGAIDRVTLPKLVQQQLGQSKSVEETLKIYADNGIWYDLLTTLNIERTKNSEDQYFNQMWNDFIAQKPGISLGELINQPFVK